MKKMRLQTNIFAAILLALNFSALANNYQTLPKGVSTVGYKFVKASTVTHKLDGSGKKASYSIKEEISSGKLGQINSFFQSYFEVLKQNSPSAYNAFTLGEYEVDAKGNVSAQGVGFGHGITSNLTVYFSVPVYHASTSVDLKQTKFSNMQAVKNALQNTSPDTLSGSMVKQFTEQLPEATGEVLQGVVTNFYGYKPLGEWKRSAIGDVELGAIYNIASFYRWGTSLAFGAVLPTGKIDDPDNLQDIETGDGQKDYFVENFTGFNLIEKRLDIDFRARYTYQQASEKELRIPESESIPLSTTKKKLKEKLGNKIELDAITSTFLNDEITLVSGVLYAKKATDKYENTNEMAKRILEKNTEEKSLAFKLGLKYSTVNLFKRKIFDVPMDIGTSFQTLVQGQNTPSYNRFDLDLRLYF